MATTSKPTTRRINRGRGHSYVLDGEKVPGITTVLGSAFPKSALIDWAARETANYAINHWEELTDAPVADRLNTLMRARFNTSNEAKLRGTTIHAFAERLAGGEEVEVPDDYRDHVDAYLSFVEDWQPAELMVEVPVFSRRFRYAGTPDLVAVLKDGRTWMLDWKTGVRGGVFLDFVLQLAAARFADFALDENGEEVPLPNIDATGIVTLTASGYKLVPVEANHDAFRMFVWLRWMVAEMIDNPEAWIGDPL